MSRFNILRNANVRNSTSCRNDSNEGYAVSWEDDNDFQQYEEFSGLTTRLVSSQNYFFVATSGTCYISPIVNQPSFDAGSYDTVKVSYRVDVGFNQAAPTTGRIQFQTEDDPTYDADKAVDFAINPDNAYNQYTIDLSQFTEWAGSVTRLRLYPFIDGVPGNKVHVRSISVQSSSNHACTSIFDGGGICSKYGEYSHPCPWTGAGGVCQSAPVDGGVDIVEGVNDEVTVNINGYGYQTATLRPVQGGDLASIAKDLEDKLSNIGIAGYADNKVSTIFNTISVSADGTRESTSTVAIQDTPAARTLGFYDSQGTNTSTKAPGIEAASRYEPAGTIQLSKGEIAHFYLPDQNASTSSISLDPSVYASSAGRSDFASVTQEQFIDFPSKTIIDFNRPVTQTGVFSFFGYSGDGTVNTQILFFHPSADGSLTLYATESLGLGQSELAKVFDISFSRRLRKGDLIGIYDGRIYTGGDAEHPNVSYFLHDGQLTIGDTITSPELFGKGDGGLHLYVRSKDRQTEVVLDIDFDSPEQIEEIEVVATESTREEFINLTQTLSGGINGGPHITGETGFDKNGAQAPALTDLGALTDGVKYNSPASLALHPSWLDGAFSPADLYEQTEFSITVDFAKGVPVFFDISKVIIYFREVENIKMFRLDYPITTNNQDTERHWGSVSSAFDEIKLDGKLLQPSNHPIYSHPMQVTSEELTHTYEFLTYTSIEMSFPPVSARSIKYNVKNYFFNDDVSSFEQSDFELAPGPDILEMEVFSSSTPKANISDNFFFESSGDGDNFVQHAVVRDTGSTSAKYLIGYPVRKLRAHILPQGKLEVNSFSVSVSQSSLGIETNAGDNTVAMQVSYKDYSGTSTATVSNDTASSYNYYIDISPQRGAVERCILWNKLGTVDEITKSQIGPSPSVSKREGYKLRETNFSLNVPGYVADPLWMLNSNIKSYVSYDLGTTWSSVGNSVTNYNYDADDELTSKHDLYLTDTFVYVLVDLGRVRAISTVDTQRISGNERATFSTDILYSTKSPSTPEELNLEDDFIVTQTPCRWLRLRAVSHDPSSFSSVPSLSFIRVTVDPTNSLSYDNISWVSAPKLTNYVFGGDIPGDGDCGEGWNCAEVGPTNYYAIDLEEHYDPHNILIGPQMSDALSLTADIDLILPGGAASMYSSNSRVNADIAYGYANTATPSKVSWGSFGAAPPEYTRWVLIKTDNGLLDEVAIHVNDNDPDKKPQFGSVRWWTAKLGSVEKDYSISPIAGHSIKVQYLENQGPAEEEIETQQSFGIDKYLAKKDQLKVLIYISDVSQVDMSKGHIAIGINTTEQNGGMDPLGGTAPDRSNYFQWDMSDIASVLTSGWNTVYLPFTDNFRYGQPFLTRDDYLSLSSTSTTGRRRIRWFRVNFVGIINNESFTVRVADLDISRGERVPAKFGNGSYFAGTDYARFPLTNFNTLQGTVEFYLRPDWTKAPGCDTCDDPKDHTIFRLFSSEDFMLGLFMTGEGMRLYVTNGEQGFYLTDNNSPYHILSDINTHLAVTWDLRGERSDKGISFYVDGNLSSSIDAVDTNVATWKTDPNTTLMLGAQAWDGIITPLSSSVDGVIDNLKVYNYAKTDFAHSMNNEGLEHIRTSDELVEISIDGVNFFGSNTRGTSLPLLVRNVGPGGSFEIQVRNREQSGTTATEGQERVSFLEVTKARPG